MTINNPQPQVVMALEAKKQRAKRLNKPLNLHIPPILYPHALERQWRAAVLDIYRDLEILIESELGKRLERLLIQGQVEQGTRLDEDFDDAFTAILNGIKVKFARMWPLKRIQSAALDVGYQVSDFNKKQNDKVFRTVLEVDVFRSEPWLRNTMKSFATRNASLITKLSDDTIKNIEQIVFSSVRQGVSFRTVSEELQKKLKLSKNRADLIARDQINKLNGQLSMVRQTEMGVTRYRWRTALDERVRQTHAIREGRVYNWTSPPTDGHPGEPINCRCYAEPVITDLLD